MVTITIGRQAAARRSRPELEDEEQRQQQEPEQESERQDDDPEHCRCKLDSTVTAKSARESDGSNTASSAKSPIIVRSSHAWTGVTIAKLRDGASRSSGGRFDARDAA